MGAPARTVLVVDEDAGFRGFMALLLEAEGYAVRTAATLAELNRALIEGPPDLVIADVRLAGTAPWAVVDRLAADPATRAVPVLICTGAEHELRAGAGRLRRGRIAALLKPFDIDVVLLCAARLLTEDARLPEQAWRPPAHD